MARLTVTKAQRRNQFILSDAEPAAVAAARAELERLGHIGSLLCVEDRAALENALARMFIAGAGAAFDAEDGTVRS